MTQSTFDELATLVEKDLPPEILLRLEAWWERAPSQRGLLLQMARAGMGEELKDCFAQDMPFGTAGRRGGVGPGPNRMNPVTLATTVQGHAAYLGDREAPSVFLAWDGRCFGNLRGRLPGDGGSLSGLTSLELAKTAACVYLANGVVPVLFDPDTTPAVATPELAYHVRRLGLDGGLVVSASHNHPDDNGCKVFDAFGGQAIPPEDERLIEAMASVKSIHSLPWEETRQRARFLDPSDLARYQQHVLGVLPAHAPRSARVVFTNLHGVGDRTAGACLEQAGFALSYVEAQRPLDGFFSEVPYRVANPEVPSALDMATEQARAEGADLVLGTDPDADRIGAVLPDAEGRWRFLTGNQILSLVAAELALDHGGGVAVTTEVTTRMFRKIWEGADAQVVDHLLVGCKYIAEVINSLEREGSFSHAGHRVEGPVEAFRMGCEEAHGLVLTSDIRDKDGAPPALVLASLAARARAQGRAPWSLYLDVVRQHGAVWNQQVPLIFDGPEGSQKMAALVDGLRDQPPRDIGGCAVLQAQDRLDTKGSFGPYLSDSDRRGRNLMFFELEGGHRVVVRPSGTEPKLKIYVECWALSPGLEASDTEAEACLERAREQAQAMARGFTELALKGIGVALSPAALALDPLVPVSERQALDDQLFPAISQALDSGKETEARRLWSEYLLQQGDRAALFVPAKEELGLR